MVASVLSLWADVSQAQLLGRIMDGQRVTLAEAVASDDRVGGTSGVFLIGFIPAAIGFLLWQSRTYGNIIAMGVTAPRTTSRMAVGCWFFPLVNLARPKQVVNDLWRGSDPEAPRYIDADTLASRSVAPLIHWWWALWVMAGV